MIEGMVTPPEGRVSLVYDFTYDGGGLVRSSKHGIGKRVGACLRHHRAKGLIRSAKGLGDRIAWGVAR
jgi:hypothetical protein